MDKTVTLKNKPRENYRQPCSSPQCAEHVNISKLIFHIFRSSSQDSDLEELVICEVKSLTRK